MSESAKLYIQNNSDEEILEQIKKIRAWDGGKDYEVRVFITEDFWYYDQYSIIEAAIKENRLKEHLNTKARPSDLYRLYPNGKKQEVLVQDLVLIKKMMDLNGDDEKTAISVYLNPEHNIQIRYEVLEKVVESGVLTDTIATHYAKAGKMLKSDGNGNLFPVKYKDAGVPKRKEVTNYTPPKRKKKKTKKTHRKKRK